jgi:hypothetical protein
MNALQARVANMQTSAAKNAATLTSGVEALAMGGIGYGIGKSEQMGFADAEKYAVGAGGMAALLGSGLLRRAGMATLKTGVAIIGYKQGKGV